MYDKSKKTWSQRLKITKSEKTNSSTSTTSPITSATQSSGQNASSPAPSSSGGSHYQTAVRAMHLPDIQLSDYHNGGEFSPSALSRSMKYAEPWIYGTVRGIPARPAYHQYHHQHHPHHHQLATSANYMHHPHAAAIFATSAHPLAPTEALAVVICSCPEYLSGTKRDVKKASVCKKCRGSRLPLATIGGTVRLPTLASSKLARSNPSGAATMRVVSSTKKSRPTILDPQKDPYDLMRRTRLLSPELSGESAGNSGVGSTSTTNEKARGNPPRGRTRTRLQPPLLVSKKTSTASNASTPTTPSTNTSVDPSDSWLVEDTDALIDRNNTTDGRQRRSILRCNVNPYDLISIPKSNPTTATIKSVTSSQFHGATTTPAPTVPKTVLNTPNEFRPQRDDDFNVEDAALNDEAPPFATGNSFEASSQSSITDDCVSYNNNVQAIAGKRISLGERKITPKPLVRQGLSEDSNNINNTIQMQVVDDNNSSPCAKSATVLHKAQPKRPPRDKRQQSVVAETTQIKLDVATSGACSTGSQVTILPHKTPSHPPLLVTVTPNQNIKSILKRPSTWRSISSGGEYSDDAMATTPSLRRQNSMSSSAISSASASTGEATNSSMVAATTSGCNSNSAIPTSPQSQSQFYIPMPQQQQHIRKKVQFLVEEKVIKYDQPQNDDVDKLPQKQECPLDDVEVYVERDDRADQVGQQRPHYEYYNRKCEEQKILFNDLKLEPPLIPSKPQQYTNNENTDTIQEKLHYEDVVPIQIVSTKTEKYNTDDNAEDTSIPQIKNPEGDDYDDVAKLSPNIQNTEKTKVFVEDGTRGNVIDHDKSSVTTETASYNDKDLQALGPNDTANPNRIANNRLQQKQQTVTQFRHPIRRSHSERHIQKQNHLQMGNVKPTSEGSEKRQSVPLGSNSGDNLKFKDTMALRVKTNTRTDTRELFAAMGSHLLKETMSAGMSRPKEPPPPPPPPSPLPPLQTSLPPEPVDNTDTDKQAHGDSVISIETTKSNAFTPSAYSQIQEQNSEEANNEDNLAGKFNKQSDTGEELTNEPKYQRSVIKKNNNTKSNQTQINTATPNSVIEEQVSTPSKEPLLRKQQQQQQRTVVRVAPFNKVSSTEVHRLKINHTDESLLTQSHPSSPFHMQNGYNDSVSYSSNTKKTSILINGDDCYSTMNLSCDASTPLYQSSVVVTDCASLNGDGRFYNAVFSSASPKKTSSQTPTNTSNEDHQSYEGLKMTTTLNTVTINVSSPRSAEEELIYQHNKLNTLLSHQANNAMTSDIGSARAIIPICGSNASEVNLQRSASSTSSTSTSSMTSINSSASGVSTPKRSRTLIKVDYEVDKSSQPQLEIPCETNQQINLAGQESNSNLLPEALVSHEEELLKILRNPVEAVKRNLVPHVCGRLDTTKTDKDNMRNKKMKETSILPGAVAIAKTSDDSTSSRIDTNILRSLNSSKTGERNSFIAKLLEDPMLSQVADGLETDTVAELIENSLKRLKRSRKAIDISGTKDNDDMNRMINVSLLKVKEERNAAISTVTHPSPQSTISNNAHLTVPIKDEDHHSNRGSISSANSFASANNFEMFDFDANESDCYQSCSSEITSPDDDASTAATRNKFYQMLVDATLAEIEMSTTLDDGQVIDGIEETDDHHYESIRANSDPIYEEINEVPPPLPLTAPPQNDPDLEKKVARSIFEGASKYDILSYLVDAKERGVVREETFDYPINCSNPIIIEEEACDTLSELGKRLGPKKEISSRTSMMSDSSEDNQSTMSSLSPPLQPHATFTYGCSSSSLLQRKSASIDIERNDSGVGSETSKSSRSKYQHIPQLCNNNNSNPPQLSKNTPIHLCEDCDGTVETQISESGVLYAPLVCRKCGKKRIERKEIITEIVETEEKYGRDLQIILEEFCHPMLVAGLLTQEQLSAIFLNTEELLENNQTLAERMRDALDIALEQGDDDLLTINIGRIFLDFTQMLHAFESYCVRQSGSSLLLANLEKEKELLRIFLKVSQMENAVLRRMNLNSFLMVPVQRVTKYPLLLARLHKVTPAHLEGRDQLKQAQEKIELHLNHINQEAKDVPTKLWRRISSSSPNRRASCEIDMINIKLRKMAIDILEWNHDEVRFAMEGKLLYTQPTDSNWKKARTIKLTPVNALLVTNGKPSANYKAEKVMTDKLNFPNRHTGIREASLLVVKEKCGRYTLIREPLYLDRCVVCSEADWDDYFEVQEISSKDTFIFKAEDGVRTKQWYTQLQYHAQGMGAWRKRRNALANIMINGMMARN